MRVGSDVLRADGGGVAVAQLYGVIFAGAAVAFCLHVLVGSQSSALSQVLAVLGNATCGWSWLLVRALFRRPVTPPQWWPMAVVTGMVVIGAAVQVSGDSASPLVRMADNAAGLVSSTLLLLAAIEPLRGIGGMPLPERRFRIGFAGGYAAMLAIAVLWIDGAPFGSETARVGGTIKALCAVGSLAGMGFAIWYRMRHPMPDILKLKRRVQTDDHELGARILHAMREEQAFGRADLKVADLARRLGQADYKVTQCITGTLGYRNFNHMANTFRLAEAKRRLADAAFDHLPILTIALDCGFGSIGPFNRAFKTDTEITPTQFRSRYRSKEGLIVGHGVGSPGVS